MSHPTPERLSLFLSGELSEADAGALEEHIDVCTACREALSEVVRGRAQEQAGLAQTQVAEGQSLPVAAGEVLEGRFRIERLLGVGGMGCVFEAHQLHLNQRVALKFLLPEFARDASVVDRFTREARAAVRLKTEHVGRVLDFGLLGSGVPYLVMELLLGESVERRLTREGPFRLPLALKVVRDATWALEEAHALGIVHRDLKPANLFFARQSNGTELVKVLDFGIAKSVHPEIEAGLTTTSGKMILGTPSYMAPEQLDAERPVDARTDVWALGCVLYQLVTGKPPFEAADLVSLMYAIKRAPHPSPAALAPVLDRCLAKDPDERFASVLALRQALEDQLAGDAPSGDDAPPELVSPPARSRAGLAAGAFGLALLGAGALFAWPSPDPSPGDVGQPDAAALAADPRPVLPAPPPVPPEPALVPVVPAAEAPAAMDAGGHAAPPVRRPTPARAPEHSPVHDPLDERL